MTSYEHVSVETLTVRQLGQSYFLCISVVLPISFILHLALADELDSRSYPASSGRRFRCVKPALVGANGSKSGTKSESVCTTTSGVVT